MSADDSLAMRRSKRSTAGNRMEAVLAELGDAQQDVEEDVDFQFKDEEDIFGSDFESTDEEAVQDEKDVTEKSIQEEERQVRKVARSKLDKATALAHARQKATFNPQAFEVQTPRKIERKAKHGVIIDPETGEVTETNKRKSERMSTVLNRSATVSRIVKDVQEKKVLKKPKAKFRLPTQDELLARALDMEEGNVVQHRDYLMLEEEKRKRARVVRATVEGPLLRWVSKVEEVSIQEDPAQVSTPAQDSLSNYPYKSWYQASGPSQFVVNFQQPPPSHYPSPSPQVQQYASLYGRTMYPAQDPPAPPLHTRKQKVEKNYVVIEMQQSEQAPLPSWKQTMEAMFGDHVKWDEVRAYTGKNRPLSRPRERCPISGLAANYCDPRTSVPYANVDAFREITKILEHEYVWSEHFGCYIGRDDAVKVEDDYPTPLEEANTDDAMDV